MAPLKIYHDRTIEFGSNRLSPLFTTPAHQITPDVTLFTPPYKTVTGNNILFVV